MTPHEIVIHVPTIYIGPASEARPHLDDTPAGNWVQLGTSGKKNYAEEGVKVKHVQKIGLIRVAGSTLPRKATRQDEDLIISVTLLDMTLEQYKHALNNATVADTAAVSGVPGYRSVHLAQGIEVASRAILVRGTVGPYSESYRTQYWLPKVCQSGSLELVFSKDKPAGLALEFTVLEDETASEGDEAGFLEIQDAAALS